MDADGVTTLLVSFGLLVPSVCFVHRLDRRWPRRLPINLVVLAVAAYGAYEVVPPITFPLLAAGVLSGYLVDTDRSRRSTTTVTALVVFAVVVLAVSHTDQADPGFSMNSPLGAAILTNLVFLITWFAMNAACHTGAALPRRSASAAD